MKIRLEKNTLIIQLTDDEKEQLLKEGLKSLVGGQVSNITYWTPSAPIQHDDPWKSKDIDVYPKITLTDNKYPCEAGWPWKDENGHMLGGAQVDDGRKYPCEASDAVKRK